ncbi:MAG: bifunctional phosphoglucose/phosphomannose isomerase [Candidatus Moranbacteria bacterium]|nr:bifunctional phosphoglucose/phosphomannose isomerase [Candidatus Moranbacteria bacterium]
MENKIDKSNLRRVILDSPNQIADGLNLSKNIDVKGDFKSITISGMGGSALPGNVLRVFVNNVLQNSEKKRLPIFHCRSYTLPPEAYEDSLNIIVSYSGNTEETISAFNEALKNNLTCVGISNGGKIEEMCKENNVPHVKLPYPYENFQPRTATGYIVFSIFQILINVGLIDDVSSDILAIVDNLKKKVIELENRGKNLAKKLVGKTPIIYTTTKFKPLAMIWKIKINENSKTPAFYHYFPELNHNEMVGFTNPQAKFFFIMLRDMEAHPQILKRFEITSELMKKRGMESEIIDIEGKSLLEKMWSALYLGDWVSYYLALEYGQDPTPVDMVEEFKDLVKD